MNQALLTGVTDRQAAVLERLLSAFRSDTRVLSCWLGGSLGRGEADAWSDIDLHVMVGADDYPTFGEVAYQTVVQAGTPLMHWRGETTERFSGCAAFFDDGAMVDLVVHNAAHGAVMFSSPIRMVLGEEPTPASQDAGVPPMQTPKRQGEVRQRVFCFWLSVQFAAKYIARGDAVMATGHLAAARGQLVQLCDLQHAVLDWCAPPVVHATWGRLTDEERATLASTVTADAGTLAQELECLIAAAEELLAPIAEAALCGDFEAQMKEAVLCFVRDAQGR
jgi:hypothetical protein